MTAKTLKCSWFVAHAKGNYPLSGENENNYQISEENRAIVSMLKRA